MTDPTQAHTQAPTTLAQASREQALMLALHTVAQELADRCRAHLVQRGLPSAEVRLPLSFTGTDLRVNIQAGPEVRARNLADEALAEASGQRPHTPLNMAHTVFEAQALLRAYAGELQATVFAANASTLATQNAATVHGHALRVARALDVVRSHL